MPNDAWCSEPAEISALTGNEGNDIFVTFASPEKRFLGIPRRFTDYCASQIFLLQIEDEPNEDREINVAEFRRLVERVGPVQGVGVRHSDVVYGVDRLVRSVREAAAVWGGSLTVDISTFPKAAMLLILRALERLGEVTHIRMVYTEPAEYQKWLDEPISYGVRRVAVVPTFAASYRANQDLILIAFLGYERDRALGMWQSIEPNRTIAVIGSPSYQAHWEGRAEALNAALLAGLDSSSVMYVDPRNPADTYNLLKQIIQPDRTPTANYYVAPLGTKPQTAGLHYFCAAYPEAATVAYASPLEHNTEYISNGIGRSWMLARPEGAK